MNIRAHKRIQAGFMLLETMIAALVLSIGLVGLAAILAQGLAYMNVSQYEYIAQQKASETIESIFTARNQGQATWSTICNVGSTVCSNGMFLIGAQTLCDPVRTGSWVPRMTIPAAVAPSQRTPSCNPGRMAHLPPRRAFR